MKQNKTIWIITIMTLLLIASVSASELTDKLVAGFTFEDDIYPDYDSRTWGTYLTSGDPVRSSTQAYEGTYSYHFDGNDGLYYDTTLWNESSSIALFGSDVDNFTLSFRVYPTSNSANQEIISEWDELGGDWELEFLTTNKFNIHAINQDPAYWDCATDGTYNLNEWHTVQIGYNDSNIYLTVDGTTKYCGNVGFDDIQSSGNGGVTFGAGDDVSYFTGYIDEVYYFNEFLSDVELTSVNDYPYPFEDATLNATIKLNDTDTGAINTFSVDVDGVSYSTTNGEIVSNVSINESQIIELFYYDIDDVGFGVHLNFSVNVTFDVGNETYTGFSDEYFSPQNASFLLYDDVFGHVHAFTIEHHDHGNLSTTTGNIESDHELPESISFTYWNASPNNGNGYYENITVLNQPFTNQNYIWNQSISKKFYNMTFTTVQGIQNFTLTINGTNHSTTNGYIYTDIPLNVSVNLNLTWNGFTDGTKIYPDEIESKTFINNDYLYTENWIYTDVPVIEVNNNSNYLSNQIINIHGNVTDDGFITNMTINNTEFTKSGSYPNFLFLSSNPFSVGNYSVLIQTTDNDGRILNTSVSFHVSLFVNTPPTTPTQLNFTGSPYYSNEDLIVNANGSTDFDSDTITYYYQLSNGSKIFVNYTTSNTFNLDSFSNETITIHAKAYDGTDFSNDTINASRYITFYVKPPVDYVNDTEAVKLGVCPTTKQGYTNTWIAIFICIVFGFAGILMKNLIMGILGGALTFFMSLVILPCGQILGWIIIIVGIVIIMSSLSMKPK